LNDAPRTPGALARVMDLGPTAQATIPGFYAWVVTVAPAAYARGAPLVSRVAAMAGLALVFVAPLTERRSPSLARVLSIWGLVATSLLVWVLAPAGWTTPARSDIVRGVAGMIGWALFALAQVAPALPRREQAKGELSRRLVRRGDSGRVDTLMLGIAVLLAALLQGIGWQADPPERKILVRLVSLGAGVLIVGASGVIVAFRHAPRAPLAPTKRAKRALLPLALFGLWAAAGAVYELAARR
jgi:hypothetical protein